MKETPHMRKLYIDIQSQLFYMIPESFEKIYVYAAIMDQVHGMPIGEMFFYYLPKGILKKKPVNVYEIPNKFNIEEDVYSKMINKLYEYIKELRQEAIASGQKPWTNITISIEDFKFYIEYNYDDLTQSPYSNYERHIIWRYKYLQTDINSYNKKERQLLYKYLSEEKEERKDVHQENIYANKKKKVIAFDTNKEAREAEIEAEKIENEMQVNQILDVKK
ncbi:MAG: DUF600 family protein [Clostridia bacterium]|nr:DUF600 family protein [Clostridia bacterium]